MLEKHAISLFNAATAKRPAVSRKVVNKAARRPSCFWFIVSIANIYFANIITLLIMLYLFFGFQSSLSML